MPDIPPHRIIVKAICKGDPDREASLICYDGWAIVLFDGDITATRIHRKRIRPWTSGVRVPLVQDDKP